MFPRTGHVHSAVVYVLLLTAYITWECVYVRGITNFRSRAGYAKYTSRPQWVVDRVNGRRCRRLVFTWMRHDERRLVRRPVYTQRTQICACIKIGKTKKLLPVKKKLKTGIVYAYANTLAGEERKKSPVSV